MFRQILVATDLTPTSHDAVKLASQLARSEGAKLSIVHVVELPKALQAWKRPGAVVDLQQYRLIVDDQVSRARQELERQLPRASRPSTKLLIKIGVPAPEIAFVADQLDADLLIVARGRGGKLGSTAERVARMVGRTVLIAPVSAKKRVAARQSRKKSPRAGRRLALA